MTSVIEKAFQTAWGRTKEEYLHGWEHLFKTYGTKGLKYRPFGFWTEYDLQSVLEGELRVALRALGGDEDVYSNLRLSKNTFEDDVVLGKAISDLDDDTIPDILVIGRKASDQRFSLLIETKFHPCLHSSQPRDLGGLQNRLSLYYDDIGKLSSAVEKNVSELGYFCVIDDHLFEDGFGAKGPRDELQRRAGQDNVRTWPHGLSFQDKLRILDAQAKNPN